MHFSIDRTVHTTAFDKPVVDHWLERKIAQTAAGSTENKCIYAYILLFIFIPCCYSIKVQDVVLAHSVFTWSYTESLNT